tara:strand:+ start:309 stop:521 length:213 start_codon:yes stop_codon:yes gene_type:complete
MADIDLFTLEILKKHINKEIETIREHICHGVDTIEKLQYSRGRLNALEALLQDFKNLQKEKIDDDDHNQT